MAKGKMKGMVKRASSSGRRAVGKVRRNVRRNVRRSSSGGGFMEDIKQGAFAFGGGAAYPLLKNLAMKFLPAGQDGNGILPAPIVGAIVAVGEHMIGRMFLGSKAIGHGAIGAYAADLNLPARFGLNDRFQIRDYLGVTGRVADYVPALPLNDGFHVVIPGAHQMEDIGRKHRHPHFRHSMNDAGDYGTSYGASF